MTIDEIKEALVGKKIHFEKSDGEERKTDGVIADIRPINECGSVDVFLKNHVSPHWCFRKEEIETLAKKGVFEIHKDNCLHRWELVDCKIRRKLEEEIRKAFVDKLLTVKKGFSKEIFSLVVGDVNFDEYIVAIVGEDEERASIQSIRFNLVEAIKLADEGVLEETSVEMSDGKIYKDTYTLSETTREESRTDVNEVDKNNAIIINGIRYDFVRTDEAIMQCKKCALAHKCEYYGDTFCSLYKKYGYFHHIMDREELDRLCKGKTLYNKGRKVGKVFAVRRYLTWPGEKELVYMLYTDDEDTNICNTYCFTYSDLEKMLLGEKVTCVRNVVSKGSGLFELV